MSSTPISLEDERSFAESYARALPWIEGIEPDDVEPINLDIVAAVATVLGSLPEIQQLRARLAEDLPRFELQNVDRLEDIARGTSHAHARYLAACIPPDELPELYAEGVALRDSLRCDVVPLVQRGFINPKALDDVSGGSGYKNLARDLQVLVVVVRGVWTEIEGKCAIARTELDRADRVASRILRVVGLREQAPVVASEAADIRARAYTLLVRTYEKVRRAIQYLRWEQGDAESIAPSLWAGRGTRARPTPADPGDSSNAPGPTDNGSDTAAPTAPPGNTEASEARAPLAAAGSPFIP